MSNLQEARQILRTKVQDEQKTPEKDQKDQLRLKNRDYLCDKVSHLSQEAWNILINNAREIKKALAMSDEAYQMAAQCDYVVGMADMLSLQGIAYLFMGEYDIAIEKVGQSLQLSLSADHRYGQASAYTGFGSIYAALGEQNRALYYYTRSSSIFEELEVEDMRSALALYGIGQVYLDKKEPLTALPYFEKSLQYYRNANIQTGIARSINVMGNVWLAEKQYDKALECAFQSLELFRDEADNGIGKSRTLNDLGRIYHAMGDREQALEYYHQALQHRLDTKYRAGIITTYTDLGRFHLENQAFDQAKECLMNALEWCKNVQVLFKQATIHRLLSELYKAQGNFELALEEYERYHFLHEKATVEDASNQTKYLQMVHDIEKTAQENEVYRLKNIELAGLNQDLEHALEMIKDSLNYARRIQNIILPEAAELKTVFADAFVFYSPRDIVSGDFYWF